MGNRVLKSFMVPISSARRFCNPEMRYVFRSYRDGVRFRKLSLTWSASEKQDWILRRLRKIVRHAAETTSYYNNLFRKIGFDPFYDFGFEEYSALPTLDRPVLCNQAENLISSDVPSKHLLMDSTGGSTGSPIQIWLGPQERGWRESSMQFAFERVGINCRDRMAFFWGHHLDPRGSDSALDRLRSYLRNERYFDCFRLSNDVFRKYHFEFERYRPDCIVAYASALGQFAEYLAESRIEPKNYPTKCFVTGAEKLLPRHRDAIESVFGPNRPVHERYGGRDFGLVGIQVDPTNSLDFEVDWAWAMLEPETEDDESSLLVTKLHADAMPLIRYRVGDDCRFPSGSKPGHPTFALKEVIGRELDRIWLKDGSWIAGEQFPHLLKSFAIHEFMLIQDESYAVELQIVPKKDFNHLEESEIESIVEANLKGLPFCIRTVANVERTVSNKWRPVVSKVKR